MGEKPLVNFYRSSIESVLTYCIIVWFASRSEADERGFQRNHYCQKHVMYFCFVNKRILNHFPDSEII